MPDEQFARIEDAIEAIASGGIVIVVDDEDRENEGDFIAAAETITPDMLNFMLKFGRGLLCVPLLSDRARALQLEPMTHKNSSGLLQTAFTQTVDLRTLRTGVSAHERCETVHALVSESTRPEDLARPGHVQPIVAQDGGVLRRAGHTEATVDLTRLAGLQPVGVLIEILDEDGTMARRDRLLEIAASHELLVVTIEDLIRYRRRHEKLVDRVVTSCIPTKLYGDLTVHGYRVKHESQEPMALVKGDLASVEAPLVRMHSSCFTGDLLQSLRCDCSDNLQVALERIHAEGVGALVYLPQEGRGIGLIDKLRAYNLQDSGLDTIEANLALGYRADHRDYGVGIQILKDLGLSKIRLLTNNPKKLEPFIESAWDLQLVSQERLPSPINAHNERYLRTKKEKMGHTLSIEDAPAKRKETN